MRTHGQYEWEHGYSPRDMKGYRREFPSLLFNDTIVFDDSIHRVELIRMGPAHTGGDGIAFLPKEKILVTGDLFVNGNPGTVGRLLLFFISKVIENARRKFSYCFILCICA